ncbi:MAG: hypothetical protein JWR81_459 [Pseudonocardia sp.]|jgi:ferredoxin|nr:hypothetical protein [Pseudonocardia sp.]MDT7613894.1 ferredoxin [Pseudonocardiales bacterium]
MVMAEPRAEQWTVSVDHGSCIGSGMCTSTAAGRFVLGADGRAGVVPSPIDPDPSVLNAAESCPAEAITVTAVDTGTVLAGPE